MTKPYTPQLDSIPHRVISYFRRFPDEELSTKDIALKYSCEVKNVLNILQSATDAGLLKRDGQIYSAGPGIGQPTPASQPALNAFGSPITPAPGARTAPKPPRAGPIDIAAISIDDDVPLAEESTRKGGDKWGPLLARLVSVGQSFALPIECSGAIGAAIGKRHKKGDTRYKRATISATELRVWRVL